MGLGKKKDTVYVVDFGLAKQHLNNGIPLEKRESAEFRGTVTLASIS